MKFTRIKLEDVYTRPTFEIKKGTKFCIRLKIGGLFDEFDRIYLRPNLSRWAYDFGDKTIKPFKLLDFAIENQSLYITLNVKKKNKDVNEIDIFCNDLFQLYNLSKVEVKKIEVEEHR